MHDRRGAGHVEQRVALAHWLADARAEGEDQIRLLRRGDEARIGAHAQVTREMRAGAVEQALAAEGDRGRDVIRHEEVADGGLALRAPTAAAENGERALGLRQQRHHLRHGARRGVGGQHALRADVRHGHAVLLHLLADGDDDGAGAAADRHVEGMRHDLGDAPRVVDLRHPFGERREHPAVVHLLEALAVRLLDGNLADEQHHRRAVLHRHMHADGGVAGTGPARDDGHAGLARQLTLRLRHVDGAGLEAAGDELHAVSGGVETVQQVQVAFARHREHMARPVRHQRIGQQLPAAALLHPLRHAAFLPRRINPAGN